MQEADRAEPPELIVVIGEEKIGLGDVTAKVSGYSQSYNTACAISILS